MAVATKFSDEQLNYFRICCVTTDVLAQGLRTIFKQEWDNRYKATLGEWKDEPRNGLDFKNRESPRNQRRNSKLLATMINGNRAEWDCTMLFYAILYSDCIGNSVNAVVKSNVDDLRQFRNEEFAHIPRGHLSDPEFHNALTRVDFAFQALGISTLRIQEIRNQKRFPTEELAKILEKVDGLHQELQEKDEEIQEKVAELQEKEDERKLLEDQLRNEVTPFCILPPKPSHDVDGRDYEVTKITQQLKELKDGNKNRLSYLYISGNPGSGKSQLAGLVAKRFFQELTNTAFVMTLNAESIDSLLESFVSFARLLKCSEYVITNTLSSKDSEIEEKITNLKTLVSTKVKLYTSWLLVVDNVTSIPQVSAHLPESGNEQWLGGQMLITTQDTASIPLTNTFINHIPVSKGMELADATSLLATLSGITDNEMEKEVVRTLDYQPLALASAATFVKQIRENNGSSNYGWKDYLEKLNKGQRADTESLLSDTNASYPKSMTAAITLAVKNVMSSDKVLNHTFSFLSLCSQQPLNLEIVVNYIRNADEEFKDDDMIRMRIQRSQLLLIEEDDSDVYIRVHQVVRNVIKSETKSYWEGENLTVGDGVITSFFQFIDDHSLDDLDCVGDSRHVVPHLKFLNTEIQTTYNRDDIVQVVKNFTLNVRHYPDYFIRFSKICISHCEFDTAKGFLNVALKLLRHDGVVKDADALIANSLLGIIHRELGEFLHAQQYLERALAIRLQKLGPRHVDVATSYNDLATVLKDQGDLEKAKAYHERALAIQVQMLGAQHVDVARSYNNLAIVALAQGDLEQAKEYHERAIAIRLQNLGTQHIDVATSYNNLAIVVHTQGDLEQAKEYHERALAIRLQKLGAQHVDVATSYNNLALLVHAQGDLEQAKEYHERALPIRVQKLGAQHVDVATSYDNLAAVLSDQGDLEQGKEYHEHALAIRIQKLRAQHVAVATSYNNLATVLIDQGDLEQAKEYHERALAIRLQKLGAQHVDVATSYNNLAVAVHAQGDLEQATEYHERALAIRLKTFGAQHVDVATSFNNMATVLKDQGELQQAKEYHDRALAIRLHKLGGQHVDVATSYNNLAIVLRTQGKLYQAKEYHERALAIRVQKLGAQHVDVATSFNNLASVLKDQGDLEQAKQYHERALVIQLQKLGAQHVDVATSYNNLAIVLRTQGDLEQAKEYHERALAIRVQKQGTQHVDVATSFNNLAAVLKDQGDLEQAKEYYERALTIQLQKLGAHHVVVASSYDNLATVLKEQGDLEKANEYHGRALAIRVQKLGAQHVDIASSYNNMAIVLHTQGDLKQAKEYHERALAIQIQKLGAQHVDVATTYNNLATVLHDQGNLEQAKEYHKRALAIRLEKLGAQHVHVASSYNNLAVVLKDQGDLEQAKKYYERALTILMNEHGTEDPSVVTVQENLAWLCQKHENKKGSVCQLL